MFSCRRVQRVALPAVAHLDAPAGGSRCTNKHLSGHVKYTEMLQERRWDIKVFLDTGDSTWVTRDGPEVTTLSLPGPLGPLVVGGTGYYRSPLAAPSPSQGEL